MTDDYKSLIERVKIVAKRESAESGEELPTFIRLFLSIGSVLNSLDDRINALEVELGKGKREVEIDEGVSK